MPVTQSHTPRSQALAKNTRYGYTAVPNWLVDDSLRGPNAAATLGAALYLLRHVPGQTGVLHLDGDFSQTELTTDLSLAPDQLASCLAELAAMGVVTQPDADTIDVSAPIKAPCARKQLARVASNAKKEEIKKEEIKNNNRAGAHAHVDPLATGVSKAADDDEALKIIFDRYTHLFGPVNPRHTLSFASRYALAQPSANKLIADFEELAGHPLLKMQVKSINVVWEMLLMQERAANYDAHVRRYLDAWTRDYLSALEIEQRLNELIDCGHKRRVNRDSFCAYFAPEIDRLRASAKTPIESDREPLLGDVTQIGMERQNTPRPLTHAAQDDHLSPSATTWELTDAEISEATEPKIEHPTLVALPDPSEPGEDTSPCAIIDDLHDAISSTSCVRGLASRLGELVSTQHSHPELQRLSTLQAWLLDGTISFALAKSQLSGVLRRLRCAPGASLSGRSPSGG